MRFTTGARSSSMSIERVNESPGGKMLSVLTGVRTTETDQNSRRLSQSSLREIQAGLGKKDDHKHKMVLILA